MYFQKTLVVGYLLVIYSSIFIAHILALALDGPSPKQKERMFKKISSNLDSKIQNFSKCYKQNYGKKFSLLYVQILLFIPTHNVVLT
jgi:hypothetical protein